MVNPRFLALLAISLGVAASRLVPHPWNFTPVAALALFGGAHFSRRWAAFAVPLGAMILSDAVLSLTQYNVSTLFLLLLPFVYACFVLTVLLGFWIRQRPGIYRLGLSVFAASGLHFVIANLGFWLLGPFLPEPLYPMNLHGLATCYEMAIPFFKNTLAGNLLYSFVLFGCFALAQKCVVALRGDETCTEPALLPVAN